MLCRKTSVFISKACAVHGHVYDYSQVLYVRSSDPVTIICREHGPFKQTPNNHLRGARCAHCMRSRHREACLDTQYDFLIKALKVHGSRYSYNECSYVDSRTPVTIKCETHGAFTQLPCVHLRGCGCPSCGGRAKINTEQFVAKARRVHGDMYDYSDTKYTRASERVSIRCRQHGVFTQNVGNHLSGNGCPSCYIVSKPDTQSSFISKSELVHRDTYDYSAVAYLASKVPVNIICKKHGMFSQQPRVHLSGSGCPACDASKGELLVARALDDLGVEYVREYSIKSCGDIRPFRFDYMVKLESGPRFIEYNGDQHYVPIEHWGGVSHLQRTQERDALKSRYCSDNHLPLLVLSSKSDVPQAVRAFVLK